MYFLLFILFSMYGVDFTTDKKQHIDKVVIIEKS